MAPMLVPRVTEATTDVTIVLLLLREVVVKLAITATTTYINLIGDINYIVLLDI